MGFLFIILGLLLVVFFLVYLVRIVPQAHAYVIERLGAYHATWNTGIHIIIPFIDRIANKVTLKEIVTTIAFILTL